MRTFNPEEKIYIVENYFGISNADLCSRFNEEFGTQFKALKFKNYRSINGLKNGRTGQFIKGQVSINKGLTHKEMMSSESYLKVRAAGFQKGNIPKSCLPLGSERVREGGWIQVKIAMPNVWKLKHVLVWEKYHKCILPEDKHLTFLDGNRTNFNIENLAPISLEECGILNFNSLRYKDTELGQVGLNIAKMIIKIKKVRKRNEK